MARKKKVISTDEAPVDSYKHNKDKRARIPTQEESQKLTAKEKHPVKKTYDYDPSLDPQLVWAGKKEAGADFGAAVVPIYVQEKVAPEAIIARLKTHGEDPSQMLLFGQTATDQIKGAIEFYKHDDNWQNRMILGDSLLVMNSLLEKEGLRGKVQTIYIDPPYGIRFGSNWQASTRKRDVKDNKVDDLVRQPEQIKAFRDTWELGIHSYLSYLRDRLMLSRELLTESGSCFVQINDENVHLVRNLMDEVFGSENSMAIIPFIKTSSKGGKYLDVINDYLLWYAHDKTQVKYKQLYQVRSEETMASAYNWIELKNGTYRKLTSMEIDGREKIPDGKRFVSGAMISQSGGDNSAFPVEFQGKTYYPSSGTFWKTNKQGIENLIKHNRIIGVGNVLAYKRYAEDFPVVAITNWWDDTKESTFATDKKYVVQTYTKVIARCLIMTTTVQFV